MDGYNTTSQFTRRQSTSDRQLSESSSNTRPRHSPILESRQIYHNRQNLDATPSEQRLTTSPLTTPIHHPSKPATLRFDYHTHTRYPSPPLTQGLSPSSPRFSYPSPLSTIRSVRDQTPNDPRHPPRHPSPPPPTTLHRPNGSSSSSSSNSPMITLPPLSLPRPPIHRAVDHLPPTTHQHVELSTLQRKPSITQLARDHPEPAPYRLHTLDLNHVPGLQIVSGPLRKRTLSTLPSPVQFHHSLGTQQVPLPSPAAPPQPGQISRHYFSPPLPPPQSGQQTSRRYPSPPPLPTPRHDNPPPSISQPPQRSQPSRSLSQPATTPDDPSSVTVIAVDEAADMALEPLRLGFENVWTQTVQNVRQVMTKIQKDVNRLNNAERRKNVHLMRCLVSSSEKLKGQDWAVEELRKENGSLMDKALQNEHLRRENNQKIAVIDSLNRENRDLKRENEELRKKNEKVKEALTRATEFIFQYKEELAKVKADAETFRKCREASVLSASDQTMPTTDLHREITRLHAEKERERIFNDAVKQLRALTALEDLTGAREGDSEEAMPLSSTVDDRRSGSSLEASPSSCVSQVHCTIDEQQKSPIPPSPTLVISTDNEEKSEVKIDDGPDSQEMDISDVEMDDDNISVVPPITSIRTTTPNPDTEQDIRLTDEPRNFKQEPELQSELEIQRQRQRQARRGSSPPSPSSISSSRPGSRKPSPVVSKTGMKRDREQYEEGQVAEEEDDDVGIDHPGNVIPGEQKHPVPGSLLSAGTEADVDNSEEGEIIIVLERQQQKDNMPKRRKGKKVSTDEKQVTPIQVPMTPSFTTTPTAKDANPKASGRWAYYTHYRDSAPDVPTRSHAQPKRSFVTCTTTQPPPPPSPSQARLPKKLGITHMDLLYKTEKEVMVCRICLSLEQNPDSTTAERRKAKADTQKFPLNASWADLINHCQTEHAKACEDMEKLSPSQLAEMKQRTR